jgi:hypothetical protein
LERSKWRLAVCYGETEESKEKAMLARFDHRPMLTAILALTTAVLAVVVVTLATLLYTSAPAASPSSVSDGGNAGAAPANYHPGFSDPR